MRTAERRNQSEVVCHVPRRRININVLYCRFYEQPSLAKFNLKCRMKIELSRWKKVTATNCPWSAVIAALRLRHNTRLYFKENVLDYCGWNKTKLILDKCFDFCSLLLHICKSQCKLFLYFYLSIPLFCIRIVVCRSRKR